MNYLHTGLLAGLTAIAVQAAFADTVIDGDGSTFIMHYDDIYTTEMRDVMNDAAQFWADWLRSDVPIEVDVQAPSLTCSFAYNAHSDWQTPESAVNFPNAPIADTHYPIALANALAGTDLSPGNPDVVIRYNRKIITHWNCQSWYLGRDADYSFGQYGLYMETLQELGHHLGLAPLGDLMTGTLLDGLPDIYWRHLKSSKQDRMLTDMNASEIDAVAHDYDNLAFKGPHSFEAAQHLTQGRTEDALLLFSRPYNAPDLTGLHLHESMAPYQLMMITRRGAEPETDIAKAMMRDIGWPTTANRAPAILGQQPLTLPEDGQKTLTLSDFIVDDEQPELVTLSVGTGAHYTLQNQTLIPDADFAGTLQVPVTVQDAQLSSEVFMAKVTVTPVNDPPVILTTQSQTISEDTSLNVTLPMLDVQDPDSDTFTLQLMPGDHYDLDGQRVIPEQDWNGPLNVTMTVSDGELTSPAAIFTILVTPVNDPPVLINTLDQTIQEDTSLTVTLAMLDVTDPDSDTLSLTVLPGTNYQLNGNTLQPDDSWTGTLAVPVRVSDGELSSQTQTLTVHIVPVNDPPVLTGYSPVSTPEDTPITLSVAGFQFSDVDSTEHTVAIGPGSNYSVSGQTLTPTANFYGELNVAIRISDGVSLSNELMVPVTVTAVNDAPQLTAVAPQTIDEDGRLFVVRDMLNIIDPDTSDFTVNIAPGENYQVAGNEIIPDPNWSGTLSIDLTVNDGQVDSNSEALLLTVTAINDLPVITTDTLPTAQIYRPWQAQLSAEDVDGDALTFTLISAPSWLTVTDDGQLFFSPDENMIGEHTLDVRVSDALSSTGKTLTLTVLNDPTATDLSVTLSAERTIWATQAWVPLTLTLTNSGPMPVTDARLTLRFDGEWTSSDARCAEKTNDCLVTLTEDQSQTLRIDVRHTDIGSLDVDAHLSHIGLETQPDNNAAQLTLTFNDGAPTSPQYSVPAFGQGTVRAIGIADIQGGRWPEILFANGPAEASTAYRFEQSLFRPVLHTHLADASDSYAMAIVDVDNDGHRDWVLANGHGQANTLYRNLGDGTFELIGLLGEADSRAVAFADIDRDGDMDLVFANNTDDNTLYLNNGHGQFTLSRTFPARNSRRVLLYDFNWDGYPDIVFANRGFRNRLYWNRGFANRQSSVGVRSMMRLAPETNGEFEANDFGTESDLTTQMVLADLDGDGLASELVMMHDAKGDTPAQLETVHINEQEQTTTLSNASTGSVNDLSVGDYDGDGQDDVAVLRPGGALEILSQRQGQLDVIDVMDTDGADTIVMVDVDGSGRADVISANNNSNTSRLDFAGEVRDAESAVHGDSDATPLPERPGHAVPNRTMTSDTGSLGGAGLPLWLLALLMAARIRPRR